MPSFKTIDEYIAQAPEELQEVLTQLRKTIKEEAPEAEETISYSMPTFKLYGSYLVYFAAWKTHLALYPATGSMEVSEDLAQYRAGKGTFQFPLDKPIPWDVIRKIVRIRMKENKERAAQ